MKKMKKQKPIIFISYLLFSFSNGSQQQRRQRKCRKSYEKGFQFHICSIFNCVSFFHGNFSMSFSSRLLLIHLGMLDKLAQTTMLYYIRTTTREKNQRFNELNVF